MKEGPVALVLKTDVIWIPNRGSSSQVAEIWEWLLVSNRTCILKAPHGLLPNDQILEGHEELDTI